MMNVMITTTTTTVMTMTVRMRMITGEEGYAWKRRTQHFVAGLLL